MIVHPQNEPESVQSLIKKLCENISEQECGNKNIIQNKNILHKLKNKAYEVLLKKCNSNSTSLKEIEDPEQELNIQLVELKIRSKDDPFKMRRYEEFKELVDILSKESYFENELGSSVMKFLLNLKQPIAEPKVWKNQISKPSLVPAPFCLRPQNSNDNKNKFLTEILESNGPFTSKFQSLKKNKFSSKNPYLPHIVPSGNGQNGRQIIKFPRPCLPVSIDDKWDKKPVWNLSNTFNFTHNNHLPRCTFFKRDFTEENTCKELKILKKPQKAASDTSINTTATKPDDSNLIFNRNWEYLGHDKIEKSRPFASECDSLFQLHCAIDQTEPEFTAKVVSVESFIADLKALTVGIQSDSFICDDSLIFRIVPDITISDVTPDAMKDFIDEFIECGTCYKRMQVMIDNYQQKNNILYRNGSQNNNGFIFKTVCSAVSDYLIQFRQFVLSCEENSVISLYSTLREMMQQICSLALLLAIHPNSNTKLKPPTGSQFLGYLYKEISHVTQNDLVMLFVYIFKRCSTVYFKHLQKWIYHGILDDPCNELFIGFVDHYRPQTKYFYDKAYFVRKDFVPGFFQGFEDKILQCGKYVQILKAYKSNHPIFEIDYPQISVCLTYQEINVLEEKCKNYFIEIQRICGETITIKDIFKRKMENKKEFYEIVREKSKKNMKKWLEEQKKLIQKQNELKKQRLKEIQAQLEDNRKRKIEERQANIEFELKLQQEMQEQEDKKLIEENLVLQKRVNYYKELHDLIDRKNKKVTFKNPEIEIKKSPDEGDEEEIITKELILSENLESPNADTDLESCFDDDDDGDDGVKGTSPSELVDKLKEIGIKIENNNTDLNQIGIMKKSASDILNSNEISEFTRNRNKILGSTLEFNHTTTTTSTTTSTTELQVNIQQKDNKNLTEAQKNKMKILNNEFNIGDNEELLDKPKIDFPDINSNVVNLIPKSVSIESELTEFQRNRHKMMKSDNTFSNFETEPIDKRNLRLDLNTERARNRQKVLSSEFDLPPINTQKIIKNDDITPMSTTSDDICNSKQDDDDEILQQIKNELIDPNKNLILDIEKAKEKITEDDGNLSTGLSTSDNLLTPESALNTAGLMTRQGFDFTRTQNNDDSKKDVLAIEKQLPIIENIQETEDTTSNPYRRCEELLKTNFTCKPRNSVFALKKSNNHSRILDDCSSDIPGKSTTSDISNVITLTEFIQKSIIIPLNTQMEIVNNEIMRIFLDELDILSHFKSLRNYFFLMDGEFGSIICDGLIGKLESGANPMELFNYQVLHMILENALGSSIIGNDKNSINLSFIVCCDDLTIPNKFDLLSPSVLNCLSLSYHIKWPINLILNPETLQQYSNIFKYLLKVRRISWLLEDIQYNLQELRKCYGNDIVISPQYRRIQQIRHKFYHFVNMLKNHITSNALQASWKKFKDDLLNVKNMEDLYRKHTTYIKRILFLCLLNKRSIEFNNAIENIFKITIRFVRNLKSREWKRKTNEEYFTHSKYERLLADEIEFEKFIKFVVYLGNKIVKHGYQEEIGEFIGLINFNHYYSVES